MIECLFFQQFRGELVENAAVLGEHLMRFIVSREGQQVILDQRIFLPLRAAQAAESRALMAK